MISLAELAGLDVLHGPRPASPATYDRWRAILRAADPRFEFTDPPLPHYLPMALAVAATAAPPAAVLTGPVAITGLPPGVTRLPRPAGRRGDGPGQHRGPAADRDRGPDLERRPAPPAAADPVRHRRRPDPASTGSTVPRRLTLTPPRVTVGM